MSGDDPRPAGDSGLSGIRGPAPLRDLDAPAPPIEAPLVHRVTVGWGDCDPAQIAYTANIPAWGLAAIEQWYRACLGVDWYRINLDHGIGTPFVQLAFEFQGPVTPRAPLHLTVRVERLGRSSLTHTVEGTQAGRRCFTGRTTSAFVDTHALTPIPIPPNMRASIEAYVAAQGPSATEKAP
jgi:4-hydroxybenzoyl-CoA thioesterase